MSNVKIEWKDTKGPDYKTPVMKTCVFTHQNGFTWEFTISLAESHVDKYFFHSKPLGFPCQPLGVHKNWESAQKMALRISTILYQKMMVDCENAALEITEAENTSAKRKLDDIGYSAFSEIGAGDYVEEIATGATGWVIDLTDFNPVSPISQPGSITVFFDDNSEKDYEHFDWPKKLKIIPNPYMTVSRPIAENTGESTHH